MRIRALDGCQPGFSVIELLIAISLMALVSLAVFWTINALNMSQSQFVLINDQVTKTHQDILRFTSLSQRFQRLGAGSTESCTNLIENNGTRNPGILAIESGDMTFNITSEIAPSSYEIGYELALPTSHSESSVELLRIEFDNQVLNAQLGFVDNGRLSAVTLRRAEGNSQIFPFTTPQIVSGYIQFQFRLNTTEGRLAVSAGPTVLGEINTGPIDSLTEISAIIPSQTVQRFPIRNVSMTSESALLIDVFNSLTDTEMTRQLNSLREGSTWGDDSAILGMAIPSAIVSRPRYQNIPTHALVHPSTESSSVQLIQGSCQQTATAKILWTTQGEYQSHQINHPSDPDWTTLVFNSSDRDDSVAKVNLANFAPLTAFSSCKDDLLTQLTPNQAASRLVIRAPSGFWHPIPIAGIVGDSGVDVQPLDRGIQLTAANALSANAWKDILATIQWSQDNADNTSHLISSVLTIEEDATRRTVHLDGLDAPNTYALIRGCWAQ